MTPHHARRRERVIDSMRFTKSIPPFVWLMALAGCAVSRWDGTVRQWGSMREALAEGKTQGRVSLGEADRKPHAVGLGALEGLNGEALILDGASWTARVERADRLRVEAGDTDARATFLAVAYVPSWIAVPLTDDIAADQFDSALRDLAAAAGLNVSSPIPFVIEGELEGLRGHVINGQCPLRASQAEIGTERTPYRVSIDHADGTLVGFYAENSAGQLTHHDSRIHVHVLLRGDNPLVAHVDEVGVGAGAVVRFPKP